MKWIVKFFYLLIGAFVVLSFGCSSPSKIEARADKDGLQVFFADPEWDGRKIPEGCQCQRFGGTGLSPRFIVKNIPPDADAIVMEYSDRSYPQMDDGGHGILGYHIKKGTKEITISSVKGHTYNLPEGFFVIAAHAAPDWDTAGAYLPPCGGRENMYYVTIKAAALTSPDGKKYRELKKVTLDMGHR